MRPTITLAVTVVAVFIVAISTPCATNDACALVTQAQVSSDVGVSVSTGTHVTPTFVKTCTWTPTDTTKGVKAVTVSFQEASSYEAGKRLMEQTAAAMKAKEGSSSMANSSASGIGDDAYYTSMGTGYMGLMVKKGNMCLKIAIYGDMPADKKKAAAKAIALHALSNI